MNQSYVWAIVAVVLVLVAVLYFWKAYQPQQPSQESILESLEGVTAPKVNVITNPTENLPEVNPADKANPFTKTYQNPFE